MLPLFPPSFATTYESPLEDLITQNYQKGCDDISRELEANSNQPMILDSATYDDQIFKLAFTPENSISSGVDVNGGTTGDDTTTVSKKLNHNAVERNRRKRVNDLYAFLQSLLPLSSDHPKKKVSIARTVLRALKYIPELQKEVETLARKKEKLCSDSSVIKGTQEPAVGNQTNSSVVCSVSVLGDKEAVIQLISPADDHPMMTKNNNFGFLSKVLKYIEDEEDELVLLDATTFKSSGEGRLISILHLQVQRDHHIEAEKLRSKLCFFYERLITWKVFKLVQKTYFGSE